MPVQGSDVFDVSARVSRNGTTVVLRGELDSATAPRFADELERLVSHSAGQVTVDLERTTFVDLSGARALIAALNTARAQGGDIVLQAPPKSLRKALEVSGADNLFVVK